MNDYGVLTAPDTLHIERLLPGPIERVWQYLTDSDKRATWLAAGNVEQQIGIHSLLQGRLKRIDKSVRKITNESNRIRQRD